MGDGPARVGPPRRAGRRPAAENFRRAARRRSVAPMHRIAWVLAVTAVIGAAWPAPGAYVAIGAGIAAIGAGWIAYRRRAAPGAARLAGAAAIAIGAVGVLLGALRVAIVLAAIGHFERVLG